MLWPPTLVDGGRVSQGHRVQDFIQELQGTVQVDLNPAGRVLDALPGVVRPPALHKAQPQDAKAPEVIHANASCGREAWKGNGPISNGDCSRTSPGSQAENLWVGDAGIFCMPSRRAALLTKEFTGADLEPGNCALC